MTRNIARSLFLVLTQKQTNEQTNTFDPKHDLVALLLGEATICFIRFTVHW